MSSRTHIRRLARMVQARSELSYAQALSIVVAASDAGTLPYPLDEVGMERAVEKLLRSSSGAMRNTVHPGKGFVMRLGTVNQEGSTDWERWKVAVADPKGENRVAGVLIGGMAQKDANRYLANLVKDARTQGMNLTVVTLVKGLYWVHAADKREVVRPWIKGSFEEVLGTVSSTEAQVISVEANEVEPELQALLLSRAVERCAPGAIAVCVNEVGPEVEKAVETALREGRSRGQVVVIVAEHVDKVPKSWLEWVSYAVVEPSLSFVADTDPVTGGLRTGMGVAQSPVNESLVRLAEKISGDAGSLRIGTRAERNTSWVIMPSGVEESLPPSRARDEERQSYLLSSDLQPNILGNDTTVSNSGVYLLNQCEAATSWAEVEWPNWIPEEVSEAIEEFWSKGRTPGSWVKDHAVQGAPRTGRRVELRASGEGDRWVEGYYVHCWNNIGRVVKENGSWEYVSFGSDWKENSPRTQEDEYDEYEWVEKRECGCGWKRGPNGETLVVKCLEHAFD